MAGARLVVASGRFWGEWSLPWLDEHSRLLQGRSCEVIGWGSTPLDAPSAALPDGDGVPGIDEQGKRGDGAGVVLSVAHMEEGSRSNTREDRPSDSS